MKMNRFYASVISISSKYIAFSTLHMSHQATQNNNWCIFIYYNIREKNINKTLFGGHFVFENKK